MCRNLPRSAVTTVTLDDVWDTYLKQERKEIWRARNKDVCRVHISSLLARITSPRNEWGPVARKKKKKKNTRQESTLSA